MNTPNKDLENVLNSIRDLNAIEYEKIATPKEERQITPHEEIVELKTAVTIVREKTPINTIQKEHFDINPHMVSQAVIHAPSPFDTPPHSEDEVLKNIELERSNTKDDKKKVKLISLKAKQKKRLEHDEIFMLEESIETAESHDLEEEKIHNILSEEAELSQETMDFAQATTPESVQTTSDTVSVDGVLDQILHNREMKIYEQQQKQMIFLRKYIKQHIKKAVAEYCKKNI